MYFCQHSCYFTVLMMVVILALWWQSSEAYRVRTSSLNDIHYNPNIRCPGRNEVIFGQSCEHGAYIVKNLDPNCEDRYVCYVGLNEICHPGDKCAGNAICTGCGICQQCESSDKCSLCPTNQGFPIYNMLKRLMQKRVLVNNFGDLDNENTTNMN